MLLISRRIKSDPESKQELTYDIAYGRAICQGRVAIGQARRFESFAGSIFGGSVVRKTQAGAHGAVIARVSGCAFYSGRSEFIVVPDDELGRWFRLR